MSMSCAHYAMAGGSAVPACHATTYGPNALTFNGQRTWAFARRSSTCSSGTSTALRVGWQSVGRRDPRVGIPDHVPATCAGGFALHTTPQA